MALSSRVSEALLATMDSRVAPTACSTPERQKEQRNLYVGDVVLIIGQNNLCGEWPLVRAVETFPGQDGRVPVARVQMG